MMLITASSKYNAMRAATTPAAIQKIGVSKGGLRRVPVCQRRATSSRMAANTDARNPTIASATANQKTLQ
jgi:hypothetical protein